MIKRFSGQLSLSKIRRVFWRAKFPIRRQCVSCNSRKITVVSDGRLFCRRCRNLFSIFIGTALARTKLSLDIWYEIIWWFSYEFTANRTAREIDLDQKLVHRCFTIIRKAIQIYEETTMEKFLGEVEADEMYVCPKFKNRRRKKREKLRKLNAVKRGRGAKTLLQPVFGIYQRDGQVWIKFVQNVEKKTLQDIIKGKIVLESNIYTDTLTSYKGLDRSGYKHETVDHGKEEYVKKISQRKIHINGIEIEGFWGYMKERLLKHHGVSKSNLIYYVKEIEFRFNHRHLTMEQLVKKITEIITKSATPTA